MNNAQITGMRNLWESVTDSESVVKRKMTAKEMALTPHSLSRSGEFATITETGKVFIWDERFNHWASWK